MLNRIPVEVLKNHIAILGKAGSGKTYAAKGTVEHLITDAERVCIIDPTGAWHGLRSSASGKSAGFPVVIFGGSHADLPLEPYHGEAIAEVVATSKDAVIIDTSLMRVGERTRFFATFADALFRLNKGPLHLIIDEAHVFAPQGRVSDPQSGAMLHAANNLVSLGRSRGFRITLISQRPAKLHKDSLSQVETLVAMRLIAPQDRAAIEDWIKDNTEGSKGREILTSLAKLETGTGWVWAPEQDILERVKFSRIKTYDSSATPDGEVSQVVFAPIDKDAIELRLQSISKTAVDNDPARLKKRIAELEKQIATTVPVAAPVDTEKQGYLRGRTQTWNVISDEVRHLAAQLRQAMEKGNQCLSQTYSLLERAETAATKRNGEQTVSKELLRGMFEESGNKARALIRDDKVAAHALAKVTANTSGNGISPNVSPSARKILDAVHRAHPVSMSFDAAARRAGISNRSSAYGKYRTEVIQSGEVIVSGDDARLRSAEGFAAPMPDSGSVDLWVSKLPPSYGKMLRAIAHGNIEEGVLMSKEMIATDSGVSLTSSGLGSGLKELKSLGLIKETNGKYSLEDGLS